MARAYGWSGMGRTEWGGSASQICDLRVVKATSKTRLVRACMYASGLSRPDLARLIACSRYAPVSASMVFDLFALWASSVQGR